MVHEKQKGFISIYKIHLAWLHRQKRFTRLYKKENVERRNGEIWSNPITIKDIFILFKPYISGDISLSLHQYKLIRSHTNVHKLWDWMEK